MTTDIRPRHLLLALASVAVAGCYEYLPTREPAAVRSLVGQRVQLTLTDAGADALAPSVGPRVEAVEGTLLADSAGSYHLAVSLTRAEGGVETYWRGESVVVAHPFVRVVAERRFSRSRSTFVGTLMTVGVIGVTSALRGGGSSSGGVPTSGRTPGQ
jgi:hypothetical protein